jgi:hypothetical protein
VFHSARHLCTLVAVILFFAAPTLAQSGLQIVGVSNGSIANIDLVNGKAVNSHVITVPGKTVVGSFGVARDPQTGIVYAVVSYSTGGRFLITVDPATGAGTHIGQTPQVTDIAIGADGTLYATGGNFSSSPGALFVLNKATGAGTQLAQLSGGSGHTLTFNAEDGLLYHGANSCIDDCFFYVESFDPQSPGDLTKQVFAQFLGIESGSMVHLRGPFFLVGDVFNLQVVLLNVATGRGSSLPSDSVWQGLTTIPTGASCAATTLYATGPFEGPSLLHAVDPATGATTLIGPVGFNDITGIDFASDGVLYAVGRRDDDLGGVPVLMTIDPCTGQGTEVGPTGMALTEMTATPGDQLYSYSGQNLAQIDRVTGQASLTGNSGIPVGNFGLEYSPTDNKLYYATIVNFVGFPSAGTLYAIDPATGASTVVSPLTLFAISNVWLKAMDLNPADNTMYGITSNVIMLNGLPASIEALAKIDTTTHALSVVVTLTDSFATMAFKNGTPSANYQLTVIKDGTGSGTVMSSPSDIDCGATCDFSFNTGRSVTLTAAPVSGSIFDGWSGACSGKGACVVTMNAMRTVRAQFTKVYNLHLQYGAANQGRAGLITVFDPAIQTCLLEQGPCDLIVRAGAVSLHADVLQGGTFNKWEANCATDPSMLDCPLNVTGDTTVGVDFIGPSRLTVTVVTNDNGAFVSDSTERFSCVGAQTCTWDYPPGTVVDVFAAPGGSSGFQQFSGDCTGLTCHLTMNADHNVTATFINGFTLSVALAGTGAGTVTGTGINCPNTCFVFNNPGTMLTLTASPAAESSFTGWSGACSGTGTCQVTFDVAKSVTANFSFVGPFQFGAAPLPVTVPAGQSAQFNLSIVEKTGSSGTITFTCTGLPAGAACAFNPNSIPFTSGTNTTVNTQLTITTTPRTAALLNEPDGLSPIWAASVFALIFCVPRRRRRLTLLMLAVALIVFLPACGGGGHSTTTPPPKTQNGTPAGSYTVTINGSAGTSSKTTTVNLVVQ